MAYYDFLNIIFAPLLKLPVLLSIITLALIISVIVILVTKYTTNQVVMKKLKEDLKEYQNKIKGLKNEPVKAMEVQKKAMELNMKYMSHSLKPTLITFIPIILIFGWMSSIFAYENIKPQQDFTITAFFQKNTNGKAELIVPQEITIVDGKFKKIENDKATWTLNGITGEYILEIAFNGEKQQTNVLITNDKKYIDPIKKTSGQIKTVQVNLKKLVVLPIGFRDWFGWLGIYIIFSIIFTIILRKLIKVY